MTFRKGKTYSEKKESGDTGPNTLVNAVNYNELEDDALDSSGSDLESSSSPRKPRTMKAESKPSDGS